MSPADELRDRLADIMIHEAPEVIAPYGLANELMPEVLRFAAQNVREAARQVANPDEASAIHHLADEVEAS